MRLQTSARIVSWVLHPLWLPIPGVFLIFAYHTILHAKLEPVNMYSILLLVITSAVILPLVAGMLITGRRMPDSLINADLPARQWFAFLGAVAQCMLLYMFYKAGIRMYVIPYLAANVLIMITASIISARMKISFHAMGWGSVTGLALNLEHHAGPDYFWVIPAVLMASGAVLSARLILKAHSEREIYPAYIISFLTMTFILWRYGNHF